MSSLLGAPRVETNFRVNPPPFSRRSVKADDLPEDMDPTMRAICVGQSVRGHEMNETYADKEGHTYLHAAVNAYAGYTDMWPLDVLESSKVLVHAFSKGALMAAAMYGMTYAAGQPMSPQTALAVGVPLALGSVRIDKARLPIVVDNLNFVLDTCYDCLWAKSKCEAPPAFQRANLRRDICTPTAGRGSRLS